MRSPSRARRSGLGRKPSRRQPIPGADGGAAVAGVGGRWCRTGQAALKELGVSGNGSEVLRAVFLHIKRQDVSRGELRSEGTDVGPSTLPPHEYWFFSR